MMMARRRSTPPEGLTPRQLAVLQFVRDYQERHGYSPTMQELADRFAVSKVTIFEHLDALERKGWLSRAKYKARSLRIDPGVDLPEPEPGAEGLPLVGYIAAGKPIQAVADSERLDVGSMFGGGSTFVLEVRGESMIDEHIADGDYVICEQQAEPHDGQTVVALIGNEEATLKKFYREGSRVRLQPANAAFEPIVVDAGDVNIQGVVIGVIRKFRSK
ncbi:MAG: LexA repressor [Phycisphaerae bacterium]|nr:LexA repressor [Phycisphaerae bacterium]